MVIIYALIDPRTDEVKYIGQTKNLNARLVDHVCMANKHLEKKDMTPKACWLAELLKLSKQPKIEILETTTIALSNLAERHWIQYYIKNGCNLLNILCVEKEPPIQNFIGPNVQFLRLKKNLTQNQFAGLCEKEGLNIGRCEIAKIENRYRCITDIEVFKISKALGVSIEELFKN